ncbi:hypothetical protein [Marinomonas sp. IMCC 4694]|uniref:hypothetical protein n=1 Tax=Marinomonas sp. IMCC 4694 TaxID=2605432 RepID=UPI0011E6B81B|nr:hypothetical protein [Marinomonas sp. IMCC 4694]TYL48375.1 hypothetical protein FXV75_10725 [Marinomonas sp. IMCC 4694]
MMYEEYSQRLNQYIHDTSLSLTASFEALCAAQDALIAELVAKGATVAGWKIVKQEGVLIVSPIFDFQVLPAFGISIDNQVINGTELEVCFQPFVPRDIKNVSGLVESLPAFAAVELIRPAIHPTNHPACDFYFNYGVLLSNQPVVGEMTFSAGNQAYRFSVNVNDVIAEKKTVLEEGLMQCIQRGYGNKDYFFITGTLNGLVLAAESIGVNRVINQNESVVSFGLV